MKTNTSRATVKGREKKKKKKRSKVTPNKSNTIYNTASLLSPRIAIPMSYNQIALNLSKKTDLPKLNLGKP